MIDWKQLAEEVIAYRDSKGFQPTTWPDLTVRISCLSSECRELVDALYGLDSCDRLDKEHLKLDVRFECADIAMYALTILHDLGSGNWSLRVSYNGGACRFSSPPQLVDPIRKHVDDAFRAWRRDLKNDALVCIELALVALVDLRQRVLGVEGTIADDVRSKIAASSGRLATHGGKNPKS